METNSEILAKKLTYTRAYRSTRLEVTHWVINHPETLPELLNYCLKNKDEISYRAAWVLEFVCLERLDLLIPYLEQFFNILPKIERDQAIRPFSKMCMIFATHYYKKKDVVIIKALNNTYKNTMLECCLDWLITDQKVAAEAYAMETLYLLGTEIDWIHSELKIIIEQHINTKTAAYKARGKITIDKIKKYQLKNLKA
jgi:hypothetical protein